MQRLFKLIVKFLSQKQNLDIINPNRNQKEINFLTSISFYSKKNKGCKDKDSLFLSGNNYTFKLSSYSTYISSSRINIKSHSYIYSGCSGIYLFTNVFNSQYVGSAIDLYSRLKRHILNNKSIKRGGNANLYLSARKIGWDNFTWSPIVITRNYLNLFLTYSLVLLIICLDYGQKDLKINKCY